MHNPHCHRELEHGRGDLDQIATSPLGFGTPRNDEFYPLSSPACLPSSVVK